MKKLMVFKIFLITSVSMSCIFANAQEENFKCRVFGENVYDGSFSLSGQNPLEQDYKISISEKQNSESKGYHGKMYALGKVKFTDLDMETQEKLTRAMKASRRPGLITGDLIVFANTKDGNESTLKAFLMPSGEIALLQIGALEALCM